jgi:hypothetical protein
VTVGEEVGAAFDKGWPKRLADLGGPAFLRGREGAIARVSLMPDILTLVLAEPQDAPGRDTLEAFVLACVEVPVGDGAAEPETYKDAVEALAAASLRVELAERCQDVLTRRVSDNCEDEVVRWSALGASLQLAIGHPDLKHDLLRTLVRLRVKPGNPHADFARKAAKVTGVAMAHWPDPSLERVLEQLSAVPHARDEALFELGMVRLREGLESDQPGRVDELFEEARGHFERSVEAREHRPDALSYARALAMLTAIRRAEAPEVLTKRAQEIHRELAIGAAWASPAEAAWPWMGARWSELMLWQELVGLLAGMATGAFDMNADLAIRRRMLNAYVANRAVLGKEPGGVEVFVRPAIEARLLREESADAAVMAWLEAESGDPASPWREAAAALQQAIRRGGSPPGKQTRTAAHLA